MASFWLTLCSMKNSSYAGGFFPFEFNSLCESLRYGFWTTSLSLNTLETFSITSVTITIDCCGGHQTADRERRNSISSTMFVVPNRRSIVYFIFFAICLTCLGFGAQHICLLAKMIRNLFHWVRNEPKSSLETLSAHFEGWVTRKKNQKKKFKFPWVFSVLCECFSFYNRNVTDRWVVGRKPIDRQAINGCEHACVPTKRQLTAQHTVTVDRSRMKL